MNVIPVSRRGVKRSRFGSRRPRMAIQRVSRTLRYNGENKITRTVQGSLIFSSVGFNVGVGASEAISMVFDASQVTIYASPTNFVSFPIPNASELAALYDRLRIDKVELVMSSHAQASTAGSVISTYALPKWIICNDDNDGISTTTVAAISQQPNKSHYDASGKELKWTCYPKYQRVVYFTSLVSNYEPARGFVNSDTAIPHYAMKLGIANLDTLGASAAGRVDFSWKYYFTLKNVK